MASHRSGMACLSLLVTACGSTSEADPDVEGAHGTIDGVSWESGSGTTMTYSSSTHNYTLVMSSKQGTADETRLTVLLQDIQSPGSYPTGTSIPLRQATFVHGASIWETDPRLGADGGEVILTIATATRIKGHIAFTGSPAFSATSTTFGSKVVDVQFDLRVKH